jgi:hypothetical protein
MQQMLGKLAWGRRRKGEAREQRNSTARGDRRQRLRDVPTSPRQTIRRREGWTEEDRTNCLAGVHRDSCDPSVRVPEENVTAAGSNELKADSFEDSDDFLALQPGKPRHTEIC